MTMMDTNNSISNTICSDDLDIFILELNNILGEGKFTIRELIQEAGKRGLKKYWKNIKTIDDVFQVFGTNRTRDKGLCGKVLEYALFGNMPNNDPNPDLDNNRDVKTNKWKKLKSGAYRSTERIKIGTAGNTDNWSSFEKRPAYSDPKQTIIAPVKVAKSTINFGLNFFSVKVNASAKTNLPSASVFNTSIVLPL